MMEIFFHCFSLSEQCVLVAILHMSKAGLENDDDDNVCNHMSPLVNVSNGHGLECENILNSTHSL